MFDQVDPGYQQLYRVLSPDQQRAYQAADWSAIEAAATDASTCTMLQPWVGRCLAVSSLPLIPMNVVKYRRVDSLSVLVRKCACGCSKNPDSEPETRPPPTRRHSLRRDIVVSIETPYGSGRRSTLTERAWRPPPRITPRNGLTS